MKTLTLITLSLALPLIAVGAVIDPVGDTYGTGMQFDISSVSAMTYGGSTTFEIRFAGPLPGDLDVNLWGAIEIDVDRDASTGKSPEIDYPNMNFAHGVDYVIAYYFDDEPGTAFILDVTKDKFFSVPAEYGTDYFRITVPVMGLNGDPRMYYAVGVGDGLDINSPYSDIVGNDYQLMMTETPEPGTWVLGGTAFALLGLARKFRRV